MIEAQPNVLLFHAIPNMLLSAKALIDWPHHRDEGTGEVGTTPRITGWPPGPYVHQGKASSSLVCIIRERASGQSRSQALIRHSDKSSTRQDGVG
jgi:hypothetical protein